MSKKLLQLVLVLVGLVVSVLGVNIGFGGIATLGLQGAGDFFAITDQELFNVRDNHVRFGGGVLIAIGLIMIVSAFKLKQFKNVLAAIAAMFVAGGIARLSVLNPDIILSADILPSLVLELVGFPALAYWAALEGN